jgi:voltage-dependent potassium channel beta subunit
MKYNRLGSSGIKLSALSLGSWVTYGKQVDVDAAAVSMKAAYDGGVNFFDNAESYAAGKSEEIMGKALKKLGWRRGSYLVSTKIYWGLHEGPNEKNTLNRKRLMEAIDGSLERLDLDYVDLVYCHRHDPETPVEEVVWAMHDMISSGRAMYWGTSEWPASRIQEAWDIADRRNLHKPQMEQPQYNLFVRDKVETEFEPLYDSLGLGLTTWSPLASGVLTGKYANGIPAGSRLALPGYEWLSEVITPERLAGVKKLSTIAADLGSDTTTLAIAWCVKNPRVSSVITGASRPEQVKANLKAMDLVDKLDDGIMAAINELVRGIK